MNRTLLILLILLTEVCTGALKAAEKIDLPKFHGSTVKPAWISKSLSLARLESIVHASRIQQIIAFSKMQVDDSNPWIIDGIKGTGQMPHAYYKATITDLLQDDPQLVRLRRETRPGDQLFQFDSAQTSERVGEGFIVVRDGQVVFEWLDCHSLAHDANANTRDAEPCGCSERSGAGTSAWKVTPTHGSRASLTSFR